MTRFASFLLASLLIFVLLFYIVNISFIILITLFLVDEKRYLNEMFKKWFKKLNILVF